MPREQKDNTGALFPNKRKLAENHPNVTGSATINGVEMWVSGWVKEMQDGKKMISLAFKTKEPKEGAEPQSEPDDLDDGDIPF